MNKIIALPFNVTIANQEVIDVYVKKGILYEDETGYHVNNDVKSPVVITE